MAPWVDDEETGTSHYERVKTKALRSTPETRVIAVDDGYCSPDGTIWRSEQDFHDAEAAGWKPS